MGQLFLMHRRVFYEDNIFDHQDNILTAYEHALDAEKLKLKIKDRNQNGYSPLDN